VTLDVKKDLQNNYHAPDEAIDALEHAGPLAPPLPPPVGPTPQVEAKPSEKGPSPQQSGQLAQIDGSSNAAPVPGSHQPVKEIPNSTDSQSKNSSRQKPTGLFRTRPPAVVALLTQGENFEKVGNYDDAVAKYREAMRINPDPHDSFIPQFIGMALENKNDLDGAIAAYREAARIDNQGMAYFFHDLIERILAKKGDWQGALREGYIARKLDHKYGFSPDEEKKVLEHINNQESNQ
jgi:tetratricopeptide (TPR) repeat protein